MALDGVTSFLRLKDVTVTCKRMRRSLSIGGSSSVQWQKVGRSWRLRICFRRFLCVRIEIDQLQCVSCWVIIHCLSVSCTKINYSRCALVIWSSLQLTSKQWIITQQFTAGADLFLKQNNWCILFRLTSGLVNPRKWCSSRLCLCEHHCSQVDKSWCQPQKNASIVYWRLCIMIGLTGYRIGHLNAWSLINGRLSTVGTTRVCTLFK